jgi:aminopeptidase N
MNKLRYFFLVWVVLAFTAVHSQNRPARTSGKLVDTAHYYMKHSYDVLKYQLSVDLFPCYQDPYTKAFPASEVISFRVDSALNQIVLDAVNTSLLVESVGLAGISFRHASDKLTIRLNRMYQPGEIVRVKIVYFHKDVEDHAVYCSGGSLFTDNPPEGARKWLPCWDRPSDKALFELTAKVPRDVRLGSNGSLSDSLVSGDSLTYHWVSRDPMATYLMTMTSMKGFLLDIVYIHKLNHKDVLIPARFYYQFGQDPDTIEGLIGPMTNFFSGLFCEYPFEKIGFATQSDAFPWGGMENQTMINMTKNGWKEGLICHEFAHSWFGDLITCGTWADIWLNESFATYCETLWMEHQAGNTGYRILLTKKADYYLSTNPGFALYNPSWAIRTPDLNKLYNSPVIYNKGACILHQLRYVMGDSAFFRLLKSYATDTNFRFKNAVTADFIKKANEISGTDLGWFFNEWLSHPNHPLYSNKYEIIPAGPGKWSLKVLVSQYQTNTLFYKMPIQLRVVFDDSTDTVMQVNNNLNDQLFSFVFSKKPVSLVFDPYRNILLKMAVTEKGVLPIKK